MGEVQSPVMIFLCPSCAKLIIMFSVVTIKGEAYLDTYLSFQDRDRLLKQYINR